MVKLAGDRRRFPRYRISVQVKIVVKSIGTDNSYEFTTGNISTGGVFVSKDRGFYPFGTQSIMEVWIHTGDEVLFFLGKVAHMQQHGFGIRIIQIDEAEQRRLHDFIHNYAVQNPKAKLQYPHND